MHVETEARAEIRPEARAERLLAEYLRHWGLRDPSTIAARCRLWVQQAAATDDNPDTATAALELALADIDKWLDHLARRVSPNQVEAERCRGLLAIELQTLIDQHPEALLEYDALPDALLRRLQNAARPAVPAVQATRMDGQPLGELPAPLQPQWWRRFFARLTRVFLEAVSWRRAVDED